jgi:peptidyl-prolyl cis-trans isomerase-like 4
LCKIKYYNNVIFHNVQKDFLAQTGDPSGTGKGGTSIYGVLYGKQARYFQDELDPRLKHAKRGTLAMANTGKNTNGSQFYITLADDLKSLDEKYTVFGEWAEGEDGLDALKKINNAFCDDDGRPLQNIRIRHTVIIDDPFPDPKGLSEHIPDRSPEAKPDKHDVDRIADFEDPNNPMDGKTEQEIECETKTATAKTQAELLTMLGELPSADVKPMETDLFVCKLNPVTTSEDLETIFSQFGDIVSCEVVQDWKTGDSLQYAFIQFEEREACERAYFKMEDALIDDRRIHVDFSQSVSKLWSAYRKGDRSGMKEGFAGHAGGERGGRGGRKQERHGDSAHSRGGGRGGGRGGPRDGRRRSRSRDRRERERGRERWREGSRRRRSASRERSRDRRRGGDRERRRRSRSRSRDRRRRR